MPKPPAPFSPSSPLVAAIAAKMEERAAHHAARAAAATGVAAATGADPDAELLQRCATIDKARGSPKAVDLETWQRDILRASTIQPLTLPNLRAQVDIALMMVGLEPEPGDELENIDRVVIWLTLADLRDLLADLPA